MKKAEAHTQSKRCNNILLVALIFVCILLLEAIGRSNTYNPLRANSNDVDKKTPHTQNQHKHKVKKDDTEKKRKKQRKMPPWKRDTCKSLYKTKGNKQYELEDRQHSPLIFERDNVMVCRTPKVGSAELRCLQRSYELKEEFEMLKNANCRPVERDILSELHDLEDPKQHNRWLYSKEVKRIMFVRHPVKRILSGFIQVAKTKTEDMWQSYGFEDKGHGPDAFQFFLFNTSFIYEHDPICSKASTYFSLESWSQHWAPPQHCRCGIWDCDVDWKVYKVEEQTIGTVMNKYVPGPWVPNDADRSKNYHSKSYDEKKYLTPDVLRFLNKLTKIEQEFFGYQPYKIEKERK
mmetsp:Transcript_25331/g.37402  ORF Transcript_25331/g.37402 Transcript_25331/m.37402 type:complete len:348 (-) Transcript_25331:92-1135(-)